MDTIEKLCSKYSFIDHLDVDVKEMIKSSLIIENFDSDSQILSRGDQCRGFSLILKGIIRVYKISEK